MPDPISPTAWTRRGLLQAAGGAAGLGALLAASGCGTGSSGGSASQKGGGGTMRLWDHHSANQKINKLMLTDWGTKHHVKTEYTYYVPAKEAKALAVAHQSGNMPDIFSKSAGVQLSVPALVQAGWMQPLKLTDEAMKRLPPDALIDGINLINGKLYTFPIFNSRWYQDVLMINNTVAQKAGLDPKQPPATWDEFRANCAQVRKKVGGKVYGFMGNFIGAGPVGGLVQAAGFEGSWQGLEYRTGEYHFDAQPWLDTVDFFKGMDKDKLVFPGSISQPNAMQQQNRVRWAAGSSLYFLDGPWGPGLVVQNSKQFAHDFSVGPVMVPDASITPRLYTSAGGTSFFISASTDQAEDANSFLSELTTKAYYEGLAQGMDQPPLDLSVIDSTPGVLPQYKKVISFFDGTVFFEPQPIIGNADVAKVEAEIKPVQPDFKNIVGGYYTGQVPNLRKALAQHSSNMNKSLDQAIKKATAKGAKVSRADYVFANWMPGQDYTKEMYKQR